MPTVTEKEINILTAIAEDEYTELNGGEPDSAEQTVTYAFSAISSQSDGGVLASLITKNLAFFDHQAHDDDLVGLTPAGFEVYKAHKQGSPDA